MFKFLNQTVSMGNQTSEMSCVTKAETYPNYLDICELVFHLQHILKALYLSHLEAREDFPRRMP